MEIFNFANIRKGPGRVEAVNSGACLINFLANGSRAIEDQCLLINVTGLTASAIEELAQASVNAVKAAKEGK